MPLTRAEARKVALSFKGASEGEHYGQPAIYLDEQFFTRLHHKEEAVVILTGSLEMRDVMLEAEPALFYITDHYRTRPALLARLSKLNRKLLKELLAGRAAQLTAMPPIKRRAKKGAKKKKARG